MSSYILYAAGAVLIFFGLTLFSIGNIFMSFAAFVMGFLAINQGVKIKKEDKMEKTESFIDPETGEFYIREDKIKEKGDEKGDKSDITEREDRN